jgi:hypothetical protein
MKRAGVTAVGIDVNIDLEIHEKNINQKEVGQNKKRGGIPYGGQLRRQHRSSDSFDREALCL